MDRSPERKRFKPTKLEDYILEVSSEEECEGVGSDEETWEENNENSEYDATEDSSEEVGHFPVKL